MNKKDTNPDVIPASDGDELNRTAGTFTSAEPPNPHKQPAPVLKEQPEPGVTIPRQREPAYDPWDLEAARNRQKKERRVKVVTVYRVASRPRPGAFFRINADPAYRIDSLLYIEKDERDLAGDTYFVDWNFADEVLASEWACFFRPARLYLAIERHSTKPYVHYVKLPRDGEKDSDWWQSSRTIAEKAIAGWIQPYNAGGGYDYHPPLKAIGDPVWPDTAFGEILRIAFKDHFIASWDHEVMVALVGA